MNCAYRHGGGHGRAQAAAMAIAKAGSMWPDTIWLTVVPGYVPHDVATWRCNINPIHYEM
jgi:hypothetical protein